ncbi:glucose-6-phosphate isomerase [Thiomicrorhabdus sp. 6S2-11]|uniref:Glucose-6-phosphate isomerase n=1 Tax=Thiomicrorhabdus marina TaxID=2818442 RepID=A0ABS3Q363_9GAMM|nr:glucose-6-phosphate isomerase [Thiomicrorhabdus marina]MBO1926379.1 glucose-6-phosphate isomerase [Thiomicrorhabdus marina]
MKQFHAYQQLKAQAESLQQTHLNDLFTQNPERFAQFHVQMPGAMLDFSKQKITEEVLDGLVSMAEEANLQQWIERLLDGDELNHTEGRKAWHTALRDVSNPNPEVAEQWEKMAYIVDELHQKQMRGYSGKAITDVVNIGVGGSDLGPLMVTHALEMQQNSNSPDIHFVSTLDGRQLQSILAKLNPETTLFIVASKSFGTIDTLSLAETAKAWMLSSCGVETSAMRHFIGVSANPQKMTEWGILPQMQLAFWDWVGGRFSLWSSIGLTIAIQMGMDGFKQMLAGAHEVDMHFKNTPFKENIPALIGLLGVWNTNFLDLAGQAILPYDSRLKYFAGYLEQLEMESNGKHTKRNGEFVDYRTCPILWGEVGPNAQHAFYQLLHQGTERVMSDFILFKEGQGSGERATFHQNLNIANCLAQSRAMMVGQESDDPHKHYPGNQVSNTLLMTRVDAHHLGMLVAMYEHKVFTQSVIWNINPFDQWGVELGKKIALSILECIDERNATQLDQSTQGILQQIWEHNA